MRRLSLVLSFGIVACTAADAARDDGNSAKAVFAQETGLPAGAEEVVARLEASPRHGEWVKYDAGNGDSVSAWMVFPERSDGAPVVIVIHEIFGMSDWIRGVADELAAQGFIAIAPDLLSGKGPNGGGSESIAQDDLRRSVGDLESDEVNRRMAAAGTFASAHPSSNGKVGSVGFCWGGSRSFRFAAAWDGLDAAAVYYGSSPDPDVLARIDIPVLGLYGGDDNRVTSTVAPAQEEMTRLGKRYEPNIYDGAGHGFLRQQDGKDGANMAATRLAWPATVAFFRETLEGTSQ